MAIVYRARYTAAPGISKPVVIKRVLSEFAEIPAFVEMFIHEARISVGLSHGNIVQVFDFGQVEGEYFLAMELVEGQPLSRVLKRAMGQGLTQLPPPVAVSIAIELCKGLHHAHTRMDERGRPLGVVHRDVSPDNVLLSYDGEVKITDFGIAKAELAGRPVTNAGLVKGKFHYLSPEQAEGLELDARSDVYTAGVLLYRMLCGRLPIEGADYEVMERIVNGRIAPPLELNPELDVQLSQIVMRALATSRSRRFQSAEEFQQALSRWLAMRVPFFSVNALKQLMGWLYAPELKELGRQPVLPQEFLSEARQWHQAPEEAARLTRPMVETREPSLEEPGRLTEPSVKTAESPMGEDADPSVRVTVPEMAAVEEPAEQERSSAVMTWPSLEALRGSRRWVSGLVGLVLLVLAAAFLALRGPPSLEIRSAPPGAQVRLDGEFLGMTPLVVEGVARDVPHTLELVLLGREPWTQSFEAGALGESLEANLSGGEGPSREPTAGSEEARPEEEKKGPARTRPPGGSSPALSQPALAKYRLGMKAFSRGELAEAKELFWECLAQDPKAGRCFRGLGEIAARLGSKAEALEYYTRFLELDPRGEGAEEARAFVRQHRGKENR
ncbi:MAG: protein kinase [Myxococcaceae bacterium]|nr:protein kinase [Myxococcaceae bacterium]